MSFTIDTPGHYLTRAGETVKINIVRPTYVTGTLAGVATYWGVTGHYWASGETSDDDIVAKAVPKVKPAETGSDLSNPNKTPLVDMDDATATALIAKSRGTDVELWRDGKWVRVMHPSAITLSSIIRVLPAPVLSPVEIAARDHGIGVTDKNGRMIKLGDRIVVRNKSPHTMQEYWEPQYVVIYRAPSFWLRHIGGGKDAGDYGWTLRQGGGARNIEVLD